MYRLTFFQVKGESLPDSYEPVNFVKKIHTIQEMRLRDGVMCGDVVVIDYRGFPLSIALKVTPMLVYKTTLVYEVGYQKKIIIIIIIIIVSLF